MVNFNANFPWFWQILIPGSGRPTLYGSHWIRIHITAKKKYNNIINIEIWLFLFFINLIKFFPRTLVPELNGINDQWPMSNEQWAMTNDQWPMTNDQWPMTNDLWPLPELARPRPSARSGGRVGTQHPRPQNLGSIFWRDGFFKIQYQKKILVF